LSVELFVDALRELIRQIVREELAHETSPLTTKPITTSRGLNPSLLSAIDWRSFQDSKKKAREGEGAWAFAYDREGNPLSETLPILEALWESGEDEITVGEYEVKLGGRDMNLLNRRPKK